ncbi:MAG: phosphotransferase [Chloroflexi bacterium]|nr:phosphotransferase [Chloroflexota bacterium]
MTTTTTVENSAKAPFAAVPLSPQIAPPDDPGLEELSNLFDAEWVWQRYREHVGHLEVPPEQVRVRQFTHTPGRSALVSYIVEWAPDDYIPSDYFAVMLRRERPMEVFQFPDDPYLPGLKEAADSETALGLVNRHVMAVPARRISVQVVRYRPGNRAVLRHRVDKVRLYARVMRPAAIPPLLRAAELIGASGFVVPRITGHWRKGGTVWLSEIPGKNLREQIRRGGQPDPAVLLDGLETLWNAPPPVDGGRPFDLPGLYRHARRIIAFALKGNAEALGHLRLVVRSLAPFIDSWQPSGMAHNDFYDDQMLALPDGRVALVDFEEIGMGDPLLDVGNFLAHLRWAVQSRSDGSARARSAYHGVFRRAALQRFGWSKRELAFREAACVFRICTNVVRYPQPDWQDRLRSGLSLVSQTLADPA